MSNNLRRFQHGVIVFIITSATFLNSYIAVFSQLSGDGLNNSLRESTDIEKSWAKNNILVTRQININKLAVDRINERRKDLNKDLVNKSIAVDMGQEVLANEYNIFLGKYDNTSVNVEIIGSAISSDDLPISVDNSKLDCFPPIRDQKPLGSCASFSTTYYAMTHMTALARGWNEKDNDDNSIKFSPKWTYNMANGGKDEGTSIYGVYQVLSGIGAATWEDVPYNSNYTEWQVDKDIWIKALGNKADRFGVIKDIDTDTGLNNLKMLLTDGYVLNFTTGLDSWKFSTVKDDPSDSADDSYKNSRVCYWTDGKLGPHAMTIVGYNDSLWVDINNNGTVDNGEKGALRIANSWGTSWEDSGFSWIAYDAVRKVSAVRGGPGTSREQAVLGGQATWLTAKKEYKPKLLAELTVSHSKRNQMSISIGYSDITSTIPDKDLASILSSRGGELGFKGTQDKVSTTFVLDYTDLIDSNDLYMDGKKRWYLKIGDSKEDDSPLMLSDFRLINPNTGEIINSDLGYSFVTIDGEERLFWIDYGISEKESIIKSVKKTPSAEILFQVLATSIKQADNIMSAPECVYTLAQGENKTSGRVLINTLWDYATTAKVYKPVRAPTYKLRKLF